jgi:hypothetical protein
MATRHKVARVLMFGGPKDYSRKLDRPGAWLSDEKATPLDRFFCFNHTGDGKNGCTYPQQLENYKAMKLAPRYRVVDVDAEKAPFRHTRLLTSTRKVENPHTGPVSLKEYRDVWVYLLNEPVE